MNDPSCQLNSNKTRSIVIFQLRWTQRFAFSGDGDARSSARSDSSRELPYVWKKPSGIVRLHVKLPCFVFLIPSFLFSQPPSLQTSKTESTQTTYATLLISKQNKCAVLHQLAATTPVFPETSDRPGEASVAVAAGRVARWAALPCMQVVVTQNECHVPSKNSRQWSSIGCSLVSFSLYQTSLCNCKRIVHLYS